MVCVQAWEFMRLWGARFVHTCLQSVAGGL